MFDLGLYDAAIVEFAEVIASGGDFGRGYAWRGRSYLELAKYQEAIADLSQAVLKDSTVLDFYRWRGDSYIAAKIYSSAVFDFGRVIEKDPIPTAADYHGLAFSRLKSGQYWQAIDDFTQAIILEATADRFEFRGAAYYQSGIAGVTDQLWSAISDFDQAIRMEVTASRYKQRGDTYLLLNEDAKAQSDWDKACVLDIALCQ